MSHSWSTMRTILQHKTEFYMHHSLRNGINKGNRSEKNCCPPYGVIPPRVINLRKVRQANYDYS